eukprot:gnl/MRDRNA2_/MRDRNA2_134943_c0_seq1.p1 gnl/MRDRNA2_/MRDRNA2_134943_c0~~gnl/MRDRNA2_/MRDRNA2_134943_c0_seq1.p1  ORF type:complete len:174 (+),score=55.08 gnl/MRDRNA2_/MRDRNA2_134943_c0_seq1:71-592(+)
MAQGDKIGGVDGAIYNLGVDLEMDEYTDNQDKNMIDKESAENVKDLGKFRGFDNALDESKDVNDYRKDKIALRQERPKTKIGLVPDNSTKVNDLKKRKVLPSLIKVTSKKKDDEDDKQQSREHCSSAEVAPSAEKKAKMISTDNKEQSSEKEAASVLGGLAGYSSDSSSEGEG